MVLTPAAASSKLSSHVVAQIRAALHTRAATAAGASEDVLESEEIAEDVLELLEDRWS